LTKRYQIWHGNPHWEGHVSREAMSHPGAGSQRCTIFWDAYLFPHHLTIARPNSARKHTSRCVLLGDRPRCCLLHNMSRAVCQWQLSFLFITPHYA